jgi:putative transcriptional regulator
MVRLKVHELMGKHRMSMRGLAEASGLSYNTARRLYRGDVDMVKLTTLSTLCKLFDVGIQEVLEYVPDELAPPNQPRLL